jgi:hypothetical protein
MVLCPFWWLVLGMGSVPGQHRSFRVMLSLGLAQYPFRDVWSCRILLFATDTLSLKSFYKFILVRSCHHICLNNNVILCLWYKIVGVCISGLAFVWGTLFGPELGGFIRTLPNRPRDYTIWSVVEYLLPSRKGSAHLSRCNSGWFYHRWYQS